MRSKIKWGRRRTISKLKWYYRFKWFWRGAALVVTFWLFNAFIYPLWVPSLSSRASNGDAFGAVNALFSGLAFAGLIYTMIMQRQELEMQRKELAAQRKEMRESRGELEEQNRIQAEQVKIRKQELKLTKAKFELATIERYIEIEKLKFQVAPTHSSRKAPLKELIDMSDTLDELTSNIVNSLDID